MNLSKEFQEHLNRLLSIQTFSAPNDIDDIDKELLDQEIKANDILKRLNDLKNKKKELEQAKEEQQTELSKWHTI